MDEQLKKEIYASRAGTASKVANYVPEPSETRSMMEILADLSQSNPKEYEEVVDALIMEKGEEWFKNLRFDWSVNGRPKQFPPQPLEKWRAWVILAGRGFGKTKTGGNMVDLWVNTHKKGQDPIRIALLGATTGDVNALDLNTEVLTTSGWSTMETLKVGDKVYNEDGVPVKIKATSPIYYNRPCYKVKFSDGSEFVADAEHLWKTYSLADRNSANHRNKTKDKQFTVLNTEQIKDTLTVKSGQREMNNYAISLAAAINLEERFLLVEPYLLGYWLGDGTSKAASIATLDMEVLNTISSYGYKVKQYNYCSYGINAAVDIRKGRARGDSNPHSLRNKLNSLGVLNNKHIPEHYLLSSIEQRQELLAGLLDSDGSCQDSGRCLFVNTNKNLIEGIYQLIASLGYKVYINKRVHKNPNHSDTYTVYFNPDKPVFKLQRKLDKQTSNTHPRTKVKYIVDVVSVESRPVRCIQVESPTSLFLIGRNFTITHNSVMVGGTSGIMSNYPDNEKPTWTTTSRNITWRYPDSEVKAIAEMFALAIDTEIPTPKGFKSIEGLQVGDKVFDENGHPCNIIAITPINYNHKCYELVFKNGQKIIADANHLWKISTLRDRACNKDRVVNSQWIADNFSLPCKGRNSDLNIWVKLTDEVSYSKKDFKIPPYVLGAWLGDGSRSHGSIVSESSEIPDFIASYGYTVKKVKDRIQYGVHGLITQLKELGLYQNKHIPEIYKQGSIEQRKELLRGLLDTDGSVSKIGEIKFSNTNKQLIDSVYEIVCSLGGWATVIPQKKKKNCLFTYKGVTKEHNQEEGWTVYIRGLYDVFKLPRKLERCIKRRVSSDLPVISIREVESVPVKCITVDSKNHLYLTTRSYLPTHNSGEEPGRLRGPQFHYAWVDELAAFRYQEAWDMLMFGLRLGDNPQVVVTTTPRPFPILMDVLKLPTTWTTIGSTYENRSNLAPAFFSEIITKYENTTLGRQELMAEIIEEVPNAMWNSKNLDENRIHYDEMANLPEFLSVVLAIDPATTSRTSSAETGMCVAAYGENDHFYIMHLDAVKMSPEQWARRSIKLFNQYNCDKMIAEVNNGGDLVEAVIKAANPMQKVYAVHASRGKTTRAEPVAALYEQNRVHHIGRFVAGEAQMCSFNPLENPYGLKDMCLTGDSLISTDKGDVFIKDIKFGDKVLTRKGYKKVTASAQTNKNAKVYTVLLSNGKKITGTANHPIILKDNVQASLDSLVRGDIINPIEENTLWQEERQLHLMSLSMHDEFQIKNNVKSAEHYIKTLGNERPINFALGNVTTEIERKQKNTTNLNIAQSVEKNFLTTNIIPSIENSLVPVSVVGIYEENELQPVYNLTVEDNHEYYANGVLTHNCDALVWAMTWLIETTQGRNTYKPIVGGSRTKLDVYKDIFKF